MLLKRIPFVLSLVLFMLAALPISYGDTGIRATVSSVQGKVTFRDSSATEWQTLSAGQKLNEKSEIMTGSKAFCEIALGNGQASAKIDADSYVVLESLDPVSIHMQSGKIYALARNLKKGSGFEVKTPTAIAAVRGTGWIQGLKKIQVFEHTVHVQGSGGSSIDVPEGKEVDISDNGDLSDLQDLSDEAKEDWNSFEGGNNSGDELDTLDKHDDNLSDLKDNVDESQDKDNINDKLKADSETRGEYQF